MNAAPRWLLVGGLAAQIHLSCFVPPSLAQRLVGFNVISVPGHPFGSASAARSLTAAKRVGANAVAIIPFLWQATPSSPHVLRGAGMSDDELRMAIREAHALGFVVIVKPHLWIPSSWAGAAEPHSEHDWSVWFADYHRELERIARVAADEGAEILAVGAELVRTTDRREWVALIAGIRAIFPGKVYYFAHNIEEAESAPIWTLLDAIGVTLYPSLGADSDRTGRLSAMRAIADRLDSLSNKVGKRVFVGEIGLRSAVGAAAAPWESPEEREAHVAMRLQAEVLTDWLAVLERPSIDSVLIWRWFTDPSAGGSADTDFTVQGKLAEAALTCEWTDDCRSRRSEIAPDGEQ